MNEKNKIVLHVVALSSFLFGAVVLHTIINNYSKNYTFFWLDVNFLTAFDSALLAIGFGFFLEFYMSFKPIKILKEID